MKGDRRVEADVLETNKKQREFYNSSGRVTNLPSRMWRALRNGLLARYRRDSSVSERVYSKHREWMGRLEESKVLDLGCFQGNHLSLEMARRSRRYIGIDLSDVAIGRLSKRLEAHNCENAEALAVDFFSEEFDEDEFDLIYAYGVLHHFQDFDLLARKLKEKLKPGGMIISYDPLETSLPIRLLRGIYRPFQEDKNWEWPFTRSVLRKIENNFEVVGLHGILGRSKWGILVGLLPLKQRFKDRVIRRWVDHDWNVAEMNGDLLACMHVTMLLKNPTD